MIVYNSFIVIAFCSMGMMSGFTAINMIVGNTVTHSQHLGAVNGMAQTIAMICAAIAPTGGASVFAWSVSGDHTFPLDFHLFWVFFLALCVVLFGLASMLPNSVNKMVEGPVHFV